VGKKTLEEEENKSLQFLFRPAGAAVRHSHERTLTADEMHHGGATLK